MAIINGQGRFGVRSYVAPSTSTNPLWNSLVSYYTGDNTSNDAKGTNNATLVNGATYATGKINGGFSLDGINDYVSIPNGTFNPTSGSYTISAWMSQSSTSYLPVIFGLGGFITNSIVVYLYGGLIRFLNSNGATYQLIESPIPSSGSYHHVLCVKDTASNKYYLYVNGSLVAQATISINYVANNLETRIGSIGDGTYGFSPFAGIIDEVGLWNRALTAAEATELYNSGAGKQYIATTPTYTARTTSFAAATGITDTTILNALNTFDLGLISNGLATKMKALYPFVGGTATTHKFNFMDARDVDAAFRLTFNGGVTHSSTGVLPNGINGYVNTHINAGTSLTINSVHYSFYSRTNTSGVFVELGNLIGAYSNHLRIAANVTIDVPYVVVPFTTTSDSRGFWMGNKTSSTYRSAIRNGVTQNFDNLNISGALNPLDMFLLCRNSNGTADYFTNRECAFSSFGDGLSDTEASTFYNLVQAFQTSLSRQV
jgi:hypothetical protein